MESLESIRDNFLHRMQSNIRSFADLCNHIDNSISLGTAEISTVTKLNNIITDYWRSVSSDNETSNVNFLDTHTVDNYTGGSLLTEMGLSSDTSRDSEEESERESSCHGSEEEKEESDERSESSDRRSDYNNTESEEDSDGEIGLHLSRSYTYGSSHVSANNTSKYSNFSDNILNNEIDTDLFPIYKDRKDLLEKFDIFMSTVNVY